MKECDYWVSFSVFSGVGPVKFKLLLDYFGTAKNAWNATKKDLIKIGFGEILTARFEKFRQSFSPSSYTKKLIEKEIDFLILNDKNYPPLLKQIKNPPFVLYYRGEMVNCAEVANENFLSSNIRGPVRSFPPASAPSDVRFATSSVRAVGSLSTSVTPSYSILNNNRIIAVVGTRRITQYGQNVTEIFTQELVNAGFTIVSGLAYGVDAVAHKTTIENNGKTIAVLGSGVDQCYPSANKYLYDKIINGSGMVVSEFPLGQKPSKGSFPSRNRIIAGLSLSVLVTEGAEDSGALITADYAFQNNRRVFAVPGPITSDLSKGPFKLISKGAKLVTSVEDILNELGVDSKIKYQRSNIKNRGETKEENLILQLLENEPLHFDQIVKKTKMDAAKVGSLLSMMEIKGMVESNEAGVFQIKD